MGIWKFLCQWLTACYRICVFVPFVSFGPKALILFSDVACVLKYQSALVTCMNVAFNWWPAQSLILLGTFHFCFVFAAWCEGTVAHLSKTHLTGGSCSCAVTACVLRQLDLLLPACCMCICLLDAQKESNTALKILSCGLCVPFFTSKMCTHCKTRRGKEVWVSTARFYKHIPVVVKKHSEEKYF